MKLIKAQLKRLRANRFFTPLSGVAVLALLVPLNMGGCGGGDASAITGAVSSVFGGGGGGLGGTSGATGNKVVDIGAAAFEGFQALSMGDQKERALGQSVAINLTSRYLLVNDDRLQRYVTMVGQAVVNAAPEGGEVYVGVLDGDQTNAYSGPQGYVFITRAALRQMQDESELAGVLAHEIEHIRQQHGLQSTQTAGLLGASVKGVSAGVGQNSQPFAQLLGPLVNNFVTSVHSKGQEGSADAKAVRLTAAAGYDPNGLVRFLQRINTSGGGPNLFPSHPSSADRVQTLTAQIQRENLGGRGQTNRQRFESYTLNRG